MAQVIVVGGGLAGLSAAHTLLERGANVLLLDKQGYVSAQQPLAMLIWELKLHGGQLYKGNLWH